jgi:hypothetical protein
MVRKTNNAMWSVAWQKNVLPEKSLQMYKPSSENREIM